MSIGNLTLLIYCGLLGIFGLLAFMHCRRLPVVAFYKKKQKSLTWKAAECIFSCTFVTTLFFAFACLGCLFLYLSAQFGGHIHSPELVEFFGKALSRSMGLFVVAIASELTFISVLRMIWVRQQGQESLQ